MKIKIKSLWQKPALRVAMLFFLFGFLWILLSDRILSSFITNPRQLTGFQTIKGILFISFTTVLIFLLVRREIRKKNEFIEMVQKKRDEFESLTEEYSALGNELKLVNDRLLDANRMLSLSEEKYRSFFENINDAAFIYEYNVKIQDGRFIEVNGKFAMQLEYSQDAVMKKNLTAIFFDGASVLEEINKQLKKKTSIQLDTILLTSAGKTLPFGISIFKLTLHEKTLLLGIARNDEERVKSINQLTLAKEQAERANRLKEIFLANMSHEIRTPLNSILGFSEILSSSDPDIKKIQQFTRLIRNSSTDLLKIISDIIDLSKLETGQTKSRLKAFSFPDLIQSIRKYLETAVNTSEKNLQISFNVDCDDIKNVISDLSILYRIATILIDNAIKFTEKGTIGFSCRDLKNSRLQFSISDTGVGISDDKVPYIFDKFIQAYGASNREYGGNGVGLSIARGLINMLGGDIQVRTRVGSGTTFEYYIPVIIQS